MDHKTGADYVGIGACTPHWKELDLNKNAIAQVGAICLFGSQNVTPNTNEAPPAQGVIIFNLIHGFGLDYGYGFAFDGHPMSTFNFSDQTLIDRLTKP